ncbi:TraB/GumN family protein [Cytophagaceae bacterium ABcell3]|nr:TraB/GumN family protein [Cytophagaceae bacterium ABcell3]
MVVLRNIFYSLIIVWFSAGAVFSQEGSLLWEISGNGIEKPSYLFGTMHVKDKRAFFFGDSLLNKLDKCDAMAGEIVADLDVIKKDIGMILMPDSVNLKSLLDKDDYKTVQKYARKNLGVYALMINKIKPIFTSALVTEKMMEQDVGETIDEYLQRQAKKRDKEVFGLESISDQLEVLNLYSLEEQAEMLVDMVVNIDKYQEATLKMLHTYIAQDLEGLLVAVKDSDIGDEFSYALLEERNKKMVKRIQELLHEKPVFYAVGAGHLPGEEGILELLRKEGYTLKPLPVK